ncbi:MAG: hypothetical protein JWO06_2018, partial [Bacteroidota bacterium]|nr:hypothetical protein [Bacteroidota bacterium]
HISSLSDAILQPGQSFHFNVTASDPDNGQVDSLFILGGPMLDSVNAPVFLAVNGNPATGAFNWTTGASFARQQPYIFSIIALDNYRFSVDSTPAGLIDCKTFRVWVTDTAASACALSNINEVQSNTFSIFPNPASTELSIVTDGQRPSLISVYNFSGQKIMEQGFAPQLHISQLSQGIYFVEITANGNITRKKFVKL